LSRKASDFAEAIRLGASGVDKGPSNYPNPVAIAAARSAV